MKRKYVVILLMLLVISLSVGVARAQVVYSSHRSAVTAGGGASTGEDFGLQGGIGQTVASPPVTGGMYSLTGGFWAGMEKFFKLMLPLITKN